jgi:tetratricopeptide (TPR) repeat protein
VRAVRAGLALVDALGRRTVRVAADTAIRLAVRVGIHTGLVVVDTVGTGGRQDPVALGDMPQMAACVQARAAPDTVMVSAATWRLVQDDCTGHAVGAEARAGGDVPVPAYQVLGLRRTPSRREVGTRRGLTPLVGREAELALLHARWTQTRDGLGQVVVLSGEPGIGKSRLVQAFHERLAAEPHVRIAWRCAPDAQQSPLQPVLAHLHRLLRWHPGASPETTLRTLEARLAAAGLALPAVVPLVAALLALPLPTRYPPLTLTPQRQRHQTLEALLAWLLAETTREPVLFIVEDLHWSDPSTLEFLTLLLDQGPTARLLTLLTCRPEFAVPWGFRAHCTPLTLPRLPQAEVTEMIGRVAGGTVVPPEVVVQIAVKTDGVPLFIEELTKMVLESGLLHEGEGRRALPGPLPSLAIPATLHDSLMARLDRLGPVKMVAQLGATIGRTFAYALLRAVADLDEATLQQALRRLVEAELVYQRGILPQATYTFKHALIQDAAYHALLRSTRQQFHQRIAQVVEAQCAETRETQPELLAHHYTEAGLAAPAVEYWQRAGERSNVRSAYVEAAAHLTKGLEVLQTLPDTPTHARTELDIQLALGQVLRVLKGNSAPEVGHTWTRAHELCQQVGDTPQLAAVLGGLCTFYRTQGEIQRACELGEQLLTLAQRLHDPERLAFAHWVLGDTLFYLGEFVPAHAHLEQALAFSGTPQDRILTSPSGGVARVTAFGPTAWVMWLLGYPDQALTRSHELLTAAQELQHAFSLARALNDVMTLYKLRGEAAATQKWAEAALAIVTEQGFGQYVGTVTFARGWALAAQGRHEDGIAQMHQGLAARRAIGARLTLAEFSTRLGEAYGRIGQAAEGLRLLGEALALVGQGDRWYEAELHRIKGKLLLWQAVPDAPKAEVCFQQALAIARQQQAKSWELRAAMSLSRLSKPASYWPQSIVGLPRDLTRPTAKKPRHYWKSSGNKTSVPNTLLQQNVQYRIMGRHCAT